MAVGNHVSTKKEAPEKKINLKYQRDKDREMVRGIFHFYEVPGGELKFPFKQYKEDELENYTLMDGQICTIPLGVAKHLNKNGWYPVHTYSMDAEGKPTARIGQKVRRFGFSSLEFIDTDDLTPEGNPLVTVEAI